MGKYRLDHFEGKNAVLYEDTGGSEAVYIPWEQLPKRAMEGDWLQLVFLQNGCVRSASVLHRGIQN